MDEYQEIVEEEYRKLRKSGWGVGEPEKEYHVEQWRKGQEDN
jgi:hypothetical protein